MKVKEDKQQEYQEYVTKNSNDGYSKAVVDYTERWANMMEQKLQEGSKLEDIAKDTSHAADTEGITGFMYGCAVKALAYFWEHGEQLRRWHNLDCQLGNEGVKANENGKVLNPAVVNIGQ